MDSRGTDGMVEWRRPGDGDDALAVVLARSGPTLGRRCRVCECMCMCMYV